MPASQRLPNDLSVPLIGGAYESKSVIADSQRCVNLYPEQNPGDSEVPVTHYPVPGLVQLGVPPVPARGRGLFSANNGNFYAVCGQDVYFVDQNWKFTKLGSLLANSQTPVSMMDDGLELMIVDGSKTGYKVLLGDNSFSQIADANFLGADKVQYVLTFLVSNIPNTQSFQSTLAGEFAWDPTYIASKTGYADLLQTLVVNRLEIWLIGAKTTEIWYDAGNPAFPFAILPGVFVNHGTIAKYSGTSHDLKVYWLSKDQDGKAIVVRGKDYKVDRISTHALENEFQKYPTLSDCVSDLYQIEGHIFVRFHFPTADKTWVFDEQTAQWHQITYTDENGLEHCSLDRFATLAYDTLVAQDWRTGALYKLDPEAFTDAGAPKVYRRSWPHLVSNGRRVTYASFRADMECGQDTVDVDQPQVYLRWSDNRGISFGNPMGMPMGLVGETLTSPTWRRLGMARDRVFELFWSTPAKTALNGAWIDPLPMGS